MYENPLTLGVGTALWATAAKRGRMACRGSRCGGERGREVCGHLAHKEREGEEEEASKVESEQGNRTKNDIAQQTREEPRRRRGEEGISGKQSVEKYR